MIKISFIGDVMLGRVIGQLYARQPYEIVDKKLIESIRSADLVIANLESPVAYHSKTEGDHLQFKGNPEVLDKLQWIDVFSLSNNHITDCGTDGIDETTRILSDKGFCYNGVFKDEYKPFLYGHGNDKIAVVTATDMLNVPFERNTEWKTLRIGNNKIFDIIRQYKDKGYFVILFAHIGMLFTRFPNPFTRDYLHSCIDEGADLIVTAHSHCLGCVEEYKGRWIFYSIGDFIMDGSSFRRRESAVLKITLENNNLINWSIIPAVTNMEYMTVCPTAEDAQRMILKFNKVSKVLKKHNDDYANFFTFRYKIEMINHAFSTISFLIRQRGVIGMLKMVFMRMEEVLRVFYWLSKDRSKDRRDDDAISADRKRIKQEDLFSKI